MKTRLKIPKNPETKLLKGLVCVIAVFFVERKSAVPLAKIDEMLERNFVFRKSVQAAITNESLWLTTSFRWIRFRAKSIKVERPSVSRAKPNENLCRKQMTNHFAIIEPKLIKLEINFYFRNSCVRQKEKPKPKPQRVNQFWEKVFILGWWIFPNLSACQVAALKICKLRNFMGLIRCLTRGPSKFGSSFLCHRSPL